jgi:hypothetical protein
MIVRLRNLEEWSEDALSVAEELLHDRATGNAAEPTFTECRSDVAMPEPAVPTKPESDLAEKYEKSLKALTATAYLLAAISAFLAIVLLIARPTLDPAKWTISAQSLAVLALAFSLLWGVTGSGLRARSIWAVWTAYLLAAPNVLFGAMAIYRGVFDLRVIGGFLVNLSVVFGASVAINQRKELRRKERQRTG